MTVDELAKRRLELLVRTIATEFVAHDNSIWYSTDYVEDVDTWRKAARIAGRRLGFRVRTGVKPQRSRVWATEEP